MDSRDSAQSAGAPTRAAIRKCFPAIRPPESIFVEGAVSVFLSVSSQATSPYNARGSIFIVPPGSGIRYDPFSAHASAAVRMVPSPPSTIRTSRFCPVASISDRVISSAESHQTLGSTMPARWRIQNIFCSDSESKPPLEVLIMTPIFNSDRRMALGINHLCDGGQSFVGRSKSPCPPLDVRLGRFAQLDAARNFSVPLCFFPYTLELFLKISEIFVCKFFQIDKFISSAFQRSNYFVEFQMSRFGIAILRILNEKDH